MLGIKQLHLFIFYCKFLFNNLETFLIDIWYVKINMSVDSIFPFLSHLFYSNDLFMFAMRN